MGDGGTGVIYSSGRVKIGIFLLMVLVGSGASRA